MNTPSALVHWRGWGIAVVLLFFMVMLGWLIWDKVGRSGGKGTDIDG